MPTTTQLDAVDKALEARIQALEATGIRVTPEQVSSMLAALAINFNINVSGSGSSAPSTGDSDGGSTGSPPVPIPTTAPIDPQPLPLTMPAIYAPNAPIELGVGPDEATFRLSANQLPAEFDVLALFDDGSSRKIANNMQLDGPYSVKGQEFTFRGVMGVKPKFKIVGSGARALPDLYIVSIHYNGETYYVFGDYDSRSDVYVIDAASTYNSEQKQEILIGPWQEPDPSTLPPPAAKLTLIDGKTLEQLIADATGNVSLAAGAIYGTCLVKPGFGITGAGREQTIIDLTEGLADVREKFDKAGVVLSEGSFAADMTIRDAAISESLGQNAAGGRNVGGNGFRLERVTLAGNQNGILTNAETNGLIELIDVNFDGNGARRVDQSIYGNTHQAYIGGMPTGELRTLRCKTITPCRDVHEIKCRLGRSTHTDNELIAGDQGAAYEFPNGGTHAVIGGSIAKAPGSANTNLMVFGAENDLNKDYAPIVTFKNVVFKTGGLLQNLTKIPDAKIVFENCTALGEIPEIRGYKPENITGAITKAG